MSDVSSLELGSGQANQHAACERPGAQRAISLKDYTSRSIQI